MLTVVSIKPNILIVVVLPNGVIFPIAAVLHERDRINEFTQGEIDWGIGPAEAMQAGDQRLLNRRDIRYRLSDARLFRPF